MRLARLMRFYKESGGGIFQSIRSAVTISTNMYVIVVAVIIAAGNVRGDYYGERAFKICPFFYSHSPIEMAILAFSLRRENTMQK